MTNGVSTAIAPAWRLAASRLGISRAGLYAKLQQHGIAR